MIRHGHTSTAPRHPACISSFSCRRVWAHMAGSLCPGRRFLTHFGVCMGTRGFDVAYLASFFIVRCTYQPCTDGTRSLRLHVTVLTPLSCYKSRCFTRRRLGRAGAHMLAARGHLRRLRRSTITDILSHRQLRGSSPRHAVSPRQLLGLRGRDLLSAIPPAEAGRVPLGRAQDGPVRYWRAHNTDMCVISALHVLSCTSSTM
ncbi:hypothetical protein FKP32DRAFT_458020 [Trametes sanguinea]|nr:hypothetical protein FKP32DRAFT_458020 [Trametes sanguinea]